MDPNVEQLYSRADSLVAEFHHGGDIRHIDEAIVLDREALELCSVNHPARVVCLSRLSVDLFGRYQQLGETEGLNEAIALGRDALALCPPGNQNRSTTLGDLSVRLSARYNRLGGMEDLDEAIVLAREALVLCIPGHPNLQPSLYNLGLHLAIRYDKLGGVEDLNESITLARDALAFSPPGHPNRCSTLNNLSNRLSTRYERLGRIEDLDEPIVLSREALALCPSGHPDQSIPLNSLANRLSTRYHQLGGLEDLREAIVLFRDALALCPPEHPDRCMALDNLSVHLSIRYNQLMVTEDLNEAIVLARDALMLRPPGHPHRSMSLNNLAIRLCTQYDSKHSESGKMEDLDEAIDLCRDAVALHRPGHPDQSSSLNNLAGILSVRYRMLGRAEDLDWLVVLARAVLDLHVTGHPGRSGCLNNLSIALSDRYDRFRRVEDLDEAIVYTEEALALRQYGHPDRSQSLDHLARYLNTRFMQLREVQDQEKSFSLYAGLEQISETVSSHDLSAAKAWVDAAEEFHHPTTVLAYKTSLRLLVHHITTLPSLPQHLAVLKSFISSLAIDAFSACLRHHSPTSAVELLEQGRSVFWSQLARLRSPLDDVIASGPTGKTLADEFTQVTSLIREAIKSPGADQHDQVCSLNVELRRVVGNIRKLPGLSRFLLPLLSSDLRRAASGGPVIIVNASKYGCDALIISVDEDLIHVPLSITKQYVRHLSERLRTLILRAKSMDVTRDLGPLLRDLWDDVVSPIVKVLQTIYPSQSRIWWCPTAEFSLLPLHAAGPYRKGQQNLSSLYISSYAPTLTSLIDARRPGPSDPVTGRKHFVAIGQANARGASELLSVGTELAIIGRCVDGLATFTRIEGEESCISRVVEELRKNEWVHLACHGLPKRKQPFDSAFALHDGRFTIHHIIQCELENPEFAYLSACHTTVGDEESPDEVIHLAAAMQFAGFRSVIGTMWAVDDGETNKITPIFYKHMVDELGRLDHTRAALALNRTMRSVKIPLDQRILYIHLGA